MKHLAIHVTGKVQGVFYRASTVEKARALGLKGFVQNERDGSVYIEAEGDEGALQSLVEWCRQGPPHARVSGVTATEGPLQNFADFRQYR
ncbi:acylphosphatase [Chryseolinea soli]|uniref:acylphosphatase n=1 Tax=Chryseolinea soli TaxID=2321403 RepID=A0A385SMN3_9BACT|nr:acylphosphatase [Chryseolinea soli]AYB31195.1 acylphosphatase [Chryseolinea soli]